MMITTANIKKSSYTENHEIYLGTHTGSFKKVCTANANSHGQTNLQNISALNKTSKITSLSWGANDEILIGRANQFVKVYDCSSGNFTSNIKMIGGPIVGLARYDGQLIAGIGNGSIQILKEAGKIIDAGNHISRMRQCGLNKKLIGTGGKGRQNNLKIWDLEAEQQIFSSKNVSNDFLQLEVPVWDSDLCFIDENIVATCSRLGYIRTYDRRSQRRPILLFENKNKESLSYTCMATHGNLIHVGTTTGVARAFDARKMKTIIHTYKGFTGSVSDLCVDETGKYLFAASLDRFFRIFNSESTELQYQCYVKSKITNILVKRAEISDEYMFHFIDNSESELNDKTQPINEDSEYDELFEQMPKVSDADITSITSKKRKFLEIKESVKRAK